MPNGFEALETQHEIQTAENNKPLTATERPLLAQSGHWDRQLPDIACSLINLHTSWAARRALRAKQ